MLVHALRAVPERRAAAESASTDGATDGAPPPAALAAQSHVSIGKCSVCTTLCTVPLLITQSARGCTMATDSEQLVGHKLPSDGNGRRGCPRVALCYAFSSHHDTRPALTLDRRAAGVQSTVHLRPGAALMPGLAVHCSSASESVVFARLSTFVRPASSTMASRRHRVV